jgi:hypothetical protein
MEIDFIRGKKKEYPILLISPDHIYDLLVN